MWNGADPILKERAFGLTGNQGNHGEDVKEYYFYLDATPSHSWLHYRYKYPQRAFPYQQLIDENARRSRAEPAFSLLDSGALADYWDIDVQYAKDGPDRIHIRISASNRSAQAAELHLLPTLWCRNTWAWGDDDTAKPQLGIADTPAGAAWAVRANVGGLGEYHLYGCDPAELLFTENESNDSALWGQPKRHPFVKDAFHRHVIHGEASAVNPAGVGSKFAAWQKYQVQAGASVTLELVLSAQPLPHPFADNGKVFAARAAEASAGAGDGGAQCVPHGTRAARQRRFWLPAPHPAQVAAELFLVAERQG